MKKTWFTLGLLLGSAYYASAQNTLQYELSFPNAVHHEARVSLKIPAVPAGPLTVRMSRSSPGRYATHEFGKNIYNVQAFDAHGKSLAINPVEGDVYRIPEHGQEVRISYTIFGNWIDGTYLGIDETHAHMNIPATFMWVKGMEERPVTVRFSDIGKLGWKVATQLKPTAGADEFSAPNLQLFMDSPVELSAFKTVSWKDVNPDKDVQTIRLTVHAPDDQSVIDQYGKMVQRTTAEAKAVFGELASYDDKTYTFLQDLNPENAGDGMEHRNSTVISDRSEKVAGNETDLLGTVSHEFFHSWNVERIRPKALEPFNFEHANMSNELWFAEGFTQYYGELILKRAGFRDLKTYCNTLAGLCNSVLNTPGAAAFPAVQMSRYAVFSDAGVAVDQTNQANIFTSYYFYGASIALALDLRLRSEFNLTLDDYMKAVWKTHGKPEIPYTVPDLQAVLAKLTGKTFAEDFFRKYVYGIEKNDYAALLEKAGLSLRQSAPGKASLGSLRLVSHNGKVRVAMNTLKGSAAYQAGLDMGDYLLRIGNDELKAPADLNTFLEKYHPGDEVEISFEHRAALKTVKVKLPESATLEVVPVENSGAALTPAMQELRNSWLTSQIK